jgi:hypothetical protein
MDEMGYVGKIEQLQGRESTWFPLAELTPTGNGPLVPPMVTIQIMGGRKEKIRAGDVLGALTGDLGYTREQVGKINVNEFSTYVAVDRAIAAQAAAAPEQGRVKGKSVKARVRRQAMNIEQFMQGYKAAWEGRDERLFCALFAEDGAYHNTPFAVQRGHAQLADYWQRVKLQEDVQLSYEVLADTLGGGVAHWHVTYQVASEELFAIWARSGHAPAAARAGLAAAAHGARRRAAGSFCRRFVPGMPAVVAQPAGSTLTPPMRRGAAPGSGRRGKALTVA